VLLSPAAARAGGFDSPDPGARARAAGRAAEGEGEALRALLRDESWKVRAAAARALGRLRYQPARRELMVIAQTDFSARVRAAAAEAVKRMAPLAYAQNLATADLPPVRPAPPTTTAPAPSRAVLFGLAAAANALRVDESLAGQAAAGLRWRHADVQLTLSFPALAVAGQVRWNILPRFVLVPYLTAGAAVAYNNLAEAPGPAASLFVGGGLRVGPLSARSTPWRRFYLYAELLPNWVVSQRRPAGVPVELRTFSLPLIVGAGAELWP